MAENDSSQGNFVFFGPDANCTLALCPIQWSVYQYRPSLAANSIFIALFSVAMFVHIFLGIRWKSWFYMIMMICGCLMEIMGYAGRIILYNNPWSFGGFMIQIVFITSGPVFYTAAIYVTLAKTIQCFAPEISRIEPKIIWWIFIPADVVCLTLQAAGGALSTISSGSSQTGIHIAMAGLALQVVVLAIFCLLLGDYLVRYFRSASTSSLSFRMRVFFSFLSLAVLLILGRCAFRCYELSKGYTNSDLVTDQGLFIGLEGVPVALAVFCLCIAHPGFVFNKELPHDKPTSSESEALELSRYESI
ncbi:RTA1 like protein-domain-containing protein [Mariannaea sp. PMI_226]|nr:RTA1 like protein-domain-containing protein [Mariannaea sp. PMI_226]